MGNPLQGKITPSEFKAYKVDNAKQNGNRFVKALGHRLASGMEPSCLLALGDSTGNDNDEWFYLLGQWLASRLSSHTIKYRIWDQVTETYPLTSTPIQVGLSGMAYADIQGGHYVSANSSASLNVVGDLEVIANVRINSLSYTGTIISKMGASGNYGWQLNIGTDNKIYLSWSNDGTALITSKATVVIPYSLGSDMWFKATLDVDNGTGGNTVTFYSSVDGDSWTQMGSPVIKVGTTSIFANTGALELGAGAGGTNNIVGRFYSGIIKNGINGDVVACPDLCLCPAGRTGIAFKDLSGVIWSLVGSIVSGSPAILLLNGSVPGAGITYSTDEVRFPKQVAYEPQLAFINYGHNNSSQIDTFQTLYEGLCTQILTAYPNSGVVGVTQNPQVSPRTQSQIAIHAQINRQIVQVISKNDYGLVDAYRAFMETGNPESYINESDGVHPILIGSHLWKDETVKFMQPAVN